VKKADISKAFSDPNRGCSRAEKQANSPFFYPDRLFYPETVGTASKSPTVLRAKYQGIRRVKILRFEVPNGSRRKLHLKIKSSIF
jgi:hypothetical protein